jgi:hypothetical protein
MNFRTFATAVALVWSAAAVRPAFAQDRQPDIARELAALRAEVQQLRAEIDAMKVGATAGALPAPAIEMLQTQVAELAQVKVESESKLPVRLFGTVHAGAFANSGNANWLDNPNLVGATPADGDAGTMSASLRQTRIGIAADGPAVGSFRTNAVVAMDFFGGIPGFQTGQVMGLPRLIVAFARLEGARTALEVGQDHMILAPRDPTSLAHEVASAMLVHAQQHAEAIGEAQRAVANDPNVVPDPVSDTVLSSFGINPQITQIAVGFVPPIRRIQKQPQRREGREDRRGSSKADGCSHRSVFRAQQHRLRNQSSNGVGARTGRCQPQ